MKSTIQIPTPCIVCNGTFIAKTLVTKYCSNKCIKKALSMKKKLALIESTKVEEFNKSAAIDMKLIQSKEFLSIKEVCLLIGVSRMSLNRYMNIGLIEPIRIGSRVIIKRESIDNLLNM